MKAPYWLTVLLALGVNAAEAQHRAYERSASPSISGLSRGSGCSLAPIPVVGRVVKRSFAANGVQLASFVVEQRSGERTLLNVDVPGTMPAAIKSDVIPKLQKLTKPGSLVTVTFAACGAAGRVLMADAIDGA